MTFPSFVCGKKAKYFTTGRKLSTEGLNEIKNIVEKQYQVTQKLENLEDIKNFWRREKKEKTKEKNQNYENHHTYRSRLNLTRKAERLFIPETKELPGESVVENVDPGFFRIICGKPIKERKNFREYVEDIRTAFLFRLKTNFHKDENLLIDENYKKEVKLLNEMKKKILSCEKGFEEFLKEDYLESKTLLKIAAEEIEKSHRKLKYIKDLKEKIREYETDILKLEEKWKHYKMFQKFLFIIAPLEWRKTHDTDNWEKHTTSDPHQFDGFREPLEEVSLHCRILNFKKDIEHNKTPQLYFTDPQQLLNILSEMEKNNVRALEDCRKLSKPTENIYKELESLKRCYQRNQEIVQEEIQNFYELVQKEETMCKNTEKKFREIAFHTFRNLIVDKEFLSVSVYVEDTYESAVAQNYNNLNLITMIREIEIKLENLLLALDLLPNDIMLFCTSRFYEEQKTILAEAVEAEKKVHQMEMLLKRLSRALSSEKNKTKRRLVQRSQPPKEHMREWKIEKALELEEKEQMWFFGGLKETDQLHSLLCLK